MFYQNKLFFVAVKYTQDYKNQIPLIASLDTGNAKRPTETIVFTDGLSFSCGSIFVRGLQVHGAAIIAGYNIRPDLINANVDATL